MYKDHLGKYLSIFLLNYQHRVQSYKSMSKLFHIKIVHNRIVIDNDNLYCLLWIHQGK